MSRNIVANNFAKVLIDQAGDNERIEAFRKEIEGVLKVFKDDNVMEFLLSPQVKFEEKKEVLEDILKGKVDEIVFDFIIFVIKGNKTDLLIEIFEEYRNLACKVTGKVVAEVFSPFPLDKDDRRELEEKFSKLLDKDVEVKYIHDSSLMGGIRVMVDGQLFDGSLKGRFRQLRKELITQ